MPRLVVTSDITDGSSRRNSQYSQHGDMLQMRLLQVEEKFRSQFLYDQINAFEDKIYLCYDTFNVDVLYRMFKGLTKRTVVDARKVQTLASLRKCYVDLRSLIRCKQRHRHVERTEEEDKIVHYFTWFFKYIDYLRKLRDNFVDRIFTPLFKYFYLVGYAHADREATGESELTAPSALSFRSIDSGYSGLSGLTSAIEGERLSQSFSANSDYRQTQDARRKVATKQALIALSREFDDIKKLYDTSEIEKLAQRLSHLKERTDHLLDKEDVLQEALLCQDSQRSVFHLKIPNFGNEKLMRLVPDILLKFQKEAWLARQWLVKDDEKTKDLNDKLKKLTKLEEALQRRLSSLFKEIQLQEMELESKANLLNNLLQREDRANHLGESVYNLEKDKEDMQGQLSLLNSERGHLCEKLTHAVEKGDKKAYRELKPLYDRNKLQRYAVERQIATLNYHISVAESDMNVELELKADVIYTTNDVQDRCEEIEQKLERAKKEQKALQAALIPIEQDKLFIKEQLQVVDDQPVENNKPSQKAEYVNSFTTNPDRVVDLNSQFIRNTGRDTMKYFITSLPGDGHVSSVPMTSTALATKHNIMGRKGSFVNVSARQDHALPQPMKLIETNATQQNVPNVMASEW